MRQVEVDRIFHRLITYARAVGVKVNVTGNDNVWRPATNKIIIEEDLEGEELIATLLHELGHHLADSLYYDKGFEFLEVSYLKVYKDRKITKDQLRTVVKCEQRAWDCGEAIARMLKIKLGPWYYKEAKSSVESYKDVRKGIKDEKRRNRV